METSVDFRELCLGFDRKHIWAFIAGQSSQDFRGNPKYLFAYINNFRKDILAYWLSESEETIETVRSLGFYAFSPASPEAQFIMDRTGVIAAEQVKVEIPQGLENAVYLNLWHGIGFKTIERRLFTGEIAGGIAKKYIKHGTYYRDNQLMTVSSPELEKEFILDAGVDEEKIIRSGYPRCLYQQNFEPVRTFDHDLRGRKGLPARTKTAVYAPTYRADHEGTFARALPDIERLYRFCEEHGILFIFKMHPAMENDAGFRAAAEKYGDRPYFWFWDNKDDFYEVMHAVDLAVYDYSSIVSDMVLMGVPHYIRYIFDYDEYMGSVDNHDAYMKRTVGTIAKSFPELLDAMGRFGGLKFRESREVKRLAKDLWSYSQGKADFETIISRTLEFEPVKRSFKTLYSFDIFDTLFSRKVLEPSGIFYLVREKMEERGGFPAALVRRYPQIRHDAELNCREFMQKTKGVRQSETEEITFDSIFRRLADVYGLDEGQTQLLKEWELDAELDNVIPLRRQIELVKKLMADPMAEVVLISDMYLPLWFVREMLKKADPALERLKVFISNESGMMKSSGGLFFEVYKSFEPYYDFEKWIHYGDNDNADRRQPQLFSIRTRNVRKPVLNDIEKAMTKDLATYDAFLTAAMQARMREEYSLRDDDFVISYISLLFVPYIDWVLRDAVRRGYQTLYFVSRDGHHLKRIADAIIQARGIAMKTRYIYASRKTWRIPSYIDEIDPGFWEDYGNFNGITSKESLFSAMDLTEEKFRSLFPSVDPDRINFETKDEILALREVFKSSEAYSEYLLAKAAEERVPVEEYLRQEIDPSEKYAIVEYYGRGYNQACLRRLLVDTFGDEDIDLAFYYSICILQSSPGNTRYNFTTNDVRQIFIEAVFANMPYKSIEKYEYRENGRLYPVIREDSYDEELFESMNEILPEFARRYARLGLRTPEDTSRLLYEFVFDYYNENRDTPAFAGRIGYLKDATPLYGKTREFAPPYTDASLDLVQERIHGRADWVLTSDYVMSYARSPEKIKARYDTMYQRLPGEEFNLDRILTKPEQSQNEKFRKKYQDILKKSEAFAALYAKAAEEEMPEDLILMVTAGKAVPRGSLGYLEAPLKKIPGFRVEELCLGNPADQEEVAGKLAKAKFVIVSSPIPLFAKVIFRPETEEILVRDTAFPLYNHGRLADYFLKWQTLYTRFTGANDFAQVQVPGQSRAGLISQMFSGMRKTHTDLMGCSATDSFFKESFCEKAAAKLDGLFPESAGTVRILYMPAVRYRSKCPSWISMIDLEVLKEELGEGFSVVVNLNSAQIKDGYENTLEIPGFSKLVLEGISLRELMAACDIIVGDYRDTFFESALLHKPVYSTAFDYEEVIKVTNMSVNARDFESFLFCPVVSGAVGLAKEIRARENYDYTAMEAFRERMFDGCDGHATERLVKYIAEKGQQ
ncbi:MAG: CDP-glycerol glycerophosphotransferase family protein [Lachnospiraceae bacterium]|nr:CDP-glycerol glycerophosphotransferase family protein [Lachnospiraceae bacterium]